MHTKKKIELLKDVEGCVDEAKALYQYRMKCPKATQSIRKEIDSIQSQINISSSAYDPKADLTREIRSIIEDMHRNLF